MVVDIHTLCSTEIERVHIVCTSTVNPNIDNCHIQYLRIAPLDGEKSIEQ